MIPTIEQFNLLTTSEKIKLIQEYAPHLLNSLKKGLSSLNSQELGNLFEFANFEAAAKEVATSFTLDLTNVLANFSNVIEPLIKELNLSDNEKGLLDNIIKKTLVFAINKASSNLYSDFKNGEGLLYSTILSEKTITTLEGILDFKKAIDKNFPGLSDIIISKSAPILIGLVSAYSPALSLALKTTGTLTKVSDFLKTENLDKTITTMYHSLDKIKQDKTLSEIHETSAKITEIAQQITTSTLSDDLVSIRHRLEKFNLTNKTASETVLEISKNLDSKELLTVVAEYAENYIPSSEKEINATLESVKKAAISKLEKNGVPNELIVEVTKALDHNIEQAKSEMKKCLNSETKIMDKVGHILTAANLIAKTESRIVEIGEKNPSYSRALKECGSALKDEVNNKIRGDISKIAKEMRPDSLAKDFAKKTLGVNLANEILIKRSSTERSLGR